MEKILEIGNQWSKDLSSDELGGLLIVGLFAAMILFYALGMLLALKEGPEELNPEVFNLEEDANYGGASLSGECISKYSLSSQFNF